MEIQIHLQRGPEVEESLKGFSAQSNRPKTSRGQHVKANAAVAQQGETPSYGVTITGWHCLRGHGSAT